MARARGVREQAARALADSRGVAGSLVSGGGGSAGASTGGTGNSGCSIDKDCSASRIVLVVRIARSVSRSSTLAAAMRTVRPTATATAIAALRRSRALRAVHRGAVAGMRTEDFLPARAERAKPPRTQATAKWRSTAAGRKFVNSYPPTPHRCVTTTVLSVRVVTATRAALTGWCATTTLSRQVQAF